MNNAIKYILGQYGAAILLLFGLSLIINLGLYMEIYRPSNYKIVNCTEANCSLNVFGKKCYAKFEDDPYTEFTSVKCGYYRPGYYNISVPCDNEDDKPIVVCYGEKINKIAYIAIQLIVYLFILIVIIASIFLGIVCIFEVSDRYAAKTTTVPNGDKQPKTNFVELDEKDLNEV